MGNPSQPHDPDQMRLMEEADAMMENPIAARLSQMRKKVVPGAYGWRYPPGFPAPDYDNPYVNQAYRTSQMPRPEKTVGPIQRLLMGDAPNAEDEIDQYWPATKRR